MPRWHKWGLQPTMTIKLDGDYEEEDDDDSFNNNNKVAQEGDSVTIIDDERW